MSNLTAKELLAQAERLMRRGRSSADDLPVLTDFVQEESASAPLRQALDIAPSGSAATAAPIPQGEPQARPIEPPTASRAPQPVAAEAPGAANGAEATARVPLVPLPPGSVVMSREQFDARLAEKLEEVKHAVFVQAMQQLELHAAGRLRDRLREALLPILERSSQQIAQQLAEETAAQVRSVVAAAVDEEIRRLRERLQARRAGP
ncbi:MAG: hypothetical protein N3F11_10390 [Casimicrobiaceae bacterium]|nr:hypothetical protein [Casimicrobiaceae bacterium]